MCTIMGQRRNLLQRAGFKRIYGCRIRICVFLGILSLSCMIYGIRYTLDNYTCVYQEPNPRTSDINKPKNVSFIIVDYNKYIVNDPEDYYEGNCFITQNRGFTSIAHAVVVTGRKLISLCNLPDYREPWQLFVWLMDENPFHTLIDQRYYLSDLDNLFNWTMTYQSDSDVYIPYGVTNKRTLHVTGSDFPNSTNRSGLIVAVISNCNPAFVHTKRLEYLKVLNVTIPVSLYGACGKQSMDGLKDKVTVNASREIQNYLFYLAFENSVCKEYVTEKLFLNCFSTWTVPVVWGPSREDYAKVAPPNSFIHISDYKSPKELGEYLLYLSKNLQAYMAYHEWRKYYTVSYRLQHFSMSVWKPLCDKLNNHRYSNTSRIVESLQKYWTLDNCNPNPV